MEKQLNVNENINEKANNLTESFRPFAVTPEKCLCVCYYVGVRKTNSRARGHLTPKQTKGEIVWHLC